MENDINERSITHKLAEHLQANFPDWNVDCEFNKNLTLPKQININPEELLSQMSKKLQRVFHQEGAELFKIYKEADILHLQKQLNDPNNIEYIEELELFIFILKLRNGAEIRKTIFPDIIIHERGLKRNHIVFEAKKSKNNNKEGRLYDLLKLATLVSDEEYKYECGIFIDIPVLEHFSQFAKFERVGTCFKEVFKYQPI